MTRPKILVVEDEYMLADDCASELRRAGFEVAGPYGHLEDIQPDFREIAGALLDVNLRGTAVYPLLDRLLELHIPVTIYSGYQSHNLPARYAGLSLITKPRDCADAVKLLCAAIEEKRGRWANSPADTSRSGQTELASVPGLARQN